MPAHRKSRLLFFRAVVFSLLLNTGALVEWVGQGSYSPVFFGDGDEAGYLQVALAAAEGKTFDEMYYFEHTTDSSYHRVLTRLPNSVIDLTVGCLGKALKLTPAALGLVLDLVFAALSYLAFSCLFTLWMPSAVAETSAVMLLAYPWAFAIVNYVHLSWPWFPQLQAPPFSSHSVLPVSRAVHTQFSYPLFALSLYAMARALSPERGRGCWGRAASVLCASLLYVYFFACLTATCLSVVWGVVYCCCSRDFVLQELKQQWRKVVQAVCLYLICITPGLGILLRVSQETIDSGISPGHMSKYWYLPLETVFLTLAVALLVLRLDKKSSLRLPLTLLLSCFIAEFALMNLQQMTELPLIPAHFTVLYLHPLVTGLVALLGLGCAFRRMTWEVWILFAALVAAMCCRGISINSARADRRETVELVRFIEEHGGEQPVLAVLPFEEPFAASTPETSSRSKPTDLAALTTSHLLYQHWFARGIPLEELEAREYALGWLFTGELKLIRACALRLAQFDKFALYQNWIAMQIDRQHQCITAERIRSKISPCSIATNFKIDFVIWEPKVWPLAPALDHDILTPVWTSTSGMYHVFKFDKAAALSRFCLP
jgi:hypothetical protein